VKKQKKEEVSGSKPTAETTAELLTHSLICETTDEKSSASGDYRPSTSSVINSQGSEVELKERN
jgi:hypothetical protein